jgi:GGDEF domain-containing protein
MLHRDARASSSTGAASLATSPPRNHLQSELMRQATHDGLTGLPNRMLLLRTTADALDRIRGTRGHVALLFLDLDN